MKGIAYEESYTLTKYPIRSAGLINKVWKEYKNNKIPYTSFLDHYLLAFSNSKKWVNEDAFIDNVKRKYGILLERGKTKEEAVFYNLMLLIKKQLPTNVIRQVCYKNRNDASFECSVLIPFFWNHFYDSKKDESDEDLGYDEIGDILVYNPSPDMILCFNTELDITFVVNDECIAEMYKYQFGECSTFKFITLEMLIGSEKNYRNTLFVARDHPLDERITEAIISHSPGEICAFLPNKVVEKQQAIQFDNLLEENGKYISMISPIYDPKKLLTQSAPRKKVLMCISNGIKPESITVYENHFDEKTFTIHDIYGLTISYNDYLYSKKALVSLLSEERKYKPISRKNNKANMYSFSDEIKIHYTIEKRKGKYLARACYREILDEKTSRQYGRKLTNTVESGLRVTDMEELPGRLEQIVYRDDFALIIQKEISRYYKKKTDGLSIKTIWFLIRPRLMQISRYDDESARKLFSINDEVGKLKNDSITTERLSNLVEENNYEIKYLTQLEVIFNEAKKLGYINNNPMKSLLPVISSRASIRQNIVRKALVKKNLTTDEERIFLSKIYAQSGLVIGERKAYMYEADSYYLLTAFRFYTGIPIREALALKWEDIVYLKDVKVFSVFISKYMDNTGHIKSYAEGNKMIKVRYVPLCSTVSEMLLFRKKAILTKINSATDIDEWPIFTHKPWPADESEAVCKSKKITANAKKLLSHIEETGKIFLLPNENKENNLETDFYQYGGDIFQSNFKFQAINTAGLTNGELAYCLGTEGPNTFSTNYCD